MSKLDLIRENLFLGDICAASEILQNGSSSISHILTVLHKTSLSTFKEWQNVKVNSKPIKEAYVGDDDDDEGEFSSESALPSGNLLYTKEQTGKGLKITRMAVLVEDEKWENLLDFVDICLDFIDEGRSLGEGVLVHCYAGRSRSASIVIASLMRTERLSLEDALVSIRLSSAVSPNSGFLKQLELFEKMNFKVDRSSGVYKRFRLKALGYLFRENKRFDGAKLRDDTGLGSSGKTKYECNKCRRVLLLGDNVMRHSPGEVDLEYDVMFSNMNGKNRDCGGGEEKGQCTSVFVEPMSWMSGVVGDGVVEGKLMCPECNAKIGSFDWSGSYCSCGSKIVPAFQLQLSRVDVVVTVKDDAKNKKKNKNKKK